MSQLGMGLTASGQIVTSSKPYIIRGCVEMSHDDNSKKLQNQNLIF